MYAGNLTAQTDGEGNITIYEYNSAGELSGRYEYTAEGLLKSAISRGMRYSYAYDEMGRLKEKSASGRRLLSLSYDLNGNLTEQEDVTGKGLYTEYAYDHDKNLTMLKTVLGTEVLARTVISTMGTGTGRRRSRRRGQCGGLRHIITTA